MIQIDRDSSLSVHDQLVEQLRYLIVSGHYTVGDTMPSTRILAAQLDVSFHTVRKAYQQLEDDGLLESRVGSGFRIKERTPLSKGERMERGAAVVHEALQRLIGLGLDDREIEYLFAEQTELFSTDTVGPKLVYAGHYDEEAELCAHQLSMALQQPVEATTLTALDRHQDADYVIARYADREAIQSAIARADVAGVIVYPAPAAIEKITRLLPQHTLGLVTRHPDAIQPLTQELRHWTHFEGQIIAATVEAGSSQLAQFVKQTDLLVFTPACRRRMYPHLNQDRESEELSPVISKESLERLKHVIPT